MRVAHVGVGRKECRHHDIGAVAIDGSVGRVEKQTSHGRTGRIVQALIAFFDAAAIAIQQIAESCKGYALITAAGVADAFESASQREGCHGKRAALEGGLVGIHILNALCACGVAGGIEIDFHIAERLYHSAHLQVFGALCGSGRGNRRVEEQPLPI